ncbi:MAG: tetratricopeptide repeat protein [Vicinamibacterales bacterium]
MAVAVVSVVRGKAPLATNLRNLLLLRSVQTWPAPSTSDAWRECEPGEDGRALIEEASRVLRIAARLDCAPSRQGVLSDAAPRDDVEALWVGISLTRMQRESEAMELWRAHNVGSFFSTVALTRAHDDAAIVVRFAEYAVALAPADWNTAYVAGRQLRDIAPGRAVSFLEQAARLAPTRADPYVELGLTELRRGRFAEAMSAYERATALAASNREAWLGLGQALFYLSDWRRAIDAFATVVRLDERDPVGQFWLGRAHLYAGNREAAEQTLRSARALGDTQQTARIDEELKRLRDGAR